MSAQSRLRNQLCNAMKSPPGEAAGLVPEAGVLVWNMFWTLSSGRSYHAAGPNPLTYAEIDAFCRLYHWPLAPHHIDLIRALDEAWIESFYKRGSQPDRAAAPVTPGLFDAVFG